MNKRGRGGRSRGEKKEGRAIRTEQGSMEGERLAGRKTYAKALAKCQSQAKV